MLSDDIQHTGVGVNAAENGPSDTEKRPSSTPALSNKQRFDFLRETVRLYSACCNGGVRSNASLLVFVLGALGNCPRGVPRRAASTGYAASIAARAVSGSDSTAQVGHSSACRTWTPRVGSSAGFRALRRCPEPLSIRQSNIVGAILRRTAFRRRELEWPLLPAPIAPVESSPYSRRFLCSSGLRLIRRTSAAYAFVSETLM